MALPSLLRQWFLPRGGGIQIPKVEAEETTSGIADGVYRVQINLKHAVMANQYSMGNGAVRGSSTYNEAHSEDSQYRPMLIVEDGKGTLVLQTMPMKSAGSVGYLLELSAVESEETKASLILAEHRMTDGSLAYDDYNTDDSEVEQARGKAYPSIQALTLSDLAADYQKVQVFVPIMEAINDGSGTQIARLQMEKETLTSVSDLSGEVEYWLYKAMTTAQGDAGAEAWEALQEQIAETKTKLSNTLVALNTDSGIPIRETQEMNETEQKEQCEKLQSAIQAVTEGEVEAPDKEALQAALDKAAQIEQSQYTEDSYRKLTEAVEAGNTVMGKDNASQEEITAAAEAIETAIENLVPVSATPGWDGETTQEPQTEGAVVKITTADELAWVSKQTADGSSDFRGMTVKLMNDINLNGKEWTPIGNGSTPFKGSFDGDGHTISGLKITDAALEYVGLFGLMTSGSTGYIKNVTVQGEVAAGIYDGQQYVGGIAGQANDMVIENCVNQAQVSSHANGEKFVYMGGIIGRAQDSSISECRNEGTVSGNLAGDVGGITGIAYGTEIVSSGNTGAVTGRSEVGGIAGDVMIVTTDILGNICSIENCWNKGSVTATGAPTEAGATKSTVLAGGIAGYVNVYNKTSMKITGAYNLGEVKVLQGGSSSTAAGGLIGKVSGDNFTAANAYSTGKITMENAEKSAYAGAILGTYTSIGSMKNMYALKGMSEKVFGKKKTTLKGDFCTESELKSEDMIEKLGGSFVMDETSANGGYPLLAAEAGGKTEEPTEDPDLPQPEGKWDGQTMTEPTIQGSTVYITSAEELAWVAGQTADGSKTFKGMTLKLLYDIELNDQEWTPIGTDEMPFMGSVDGNGHAVTGLKVTKDGDYAGLFGAINSMAQKTVVNLTVKGSIKGSFTYAGGIAALASGTDFTGCTSLVEIQNGKEEANSGGIAGKVVRSTFVSCENEADISSTPADTYVGGIVARSDSEIRDCSNKGNITGGGYIGGLVGYLSASGADKTIAVENCANTGTITVEEGEYVGGIIGYASGSAKSILMNITGVYNRGNIVVSSGSAKVGGILGGTLTSTASIGTYGLKEGYNTGMLKLGEEYKGEQYGAVVGYASKLAVLEDLYALEGTADKLYYFYSEDPATGTVAFKDEAFLKSDEGLEALGERFKKDAEGTNDGFPVLKKTGEEIQPADYTAVDEAIAKAEGLTKENYKDFSKVTEAIEAVVRDLDETHQAEVDAMAQAINDAITALEYKDADYSAVEEALKKVPEDLSIYTDETAKKVTDAVNAVERKEYYRTGRSRRNGTGNQ